MHKYTARYKGQTHTWHTDHKIPMEGMITMPYKTNKERMTECHDWHLAKGENTCSDRYCDVSHLCPLKDVEVVERSTELLQEAGDKLDLNDEIAAVDTLPA